MENDLNGGVEAAERWLTGTEAAMRVRCSEQRILVAARNLEFRWKWQARPSGRNAYAIDPDDLARWARQGEPSAPDGWVSASEAATLSHISMERIQCAARRGEFKWQWRTLPGGKRKYRAIDPVDLKRWAGELPHRGGPARSPSHQCGAAALQRARLISTRSRKTETRAFADRISLNAASHHAKTSVDGLKNAIKRGDLSAEYDASGKLYVFMDDALTWARTRGFVLTAE